MTSEEFSRLAVYIKKNCGMDMSRKEGLLEGRLANYLVANGYANYSQYLYALETDSTGKEKENLLNIVTTNHTFFMREFEHLEYFKNVILPGLHKTEKDSKDIRIWSAAASTGEEAYTIAMVLKDYFALEADEWDTTVLATDISTDVLKRAVGGSYLASQVEAIPDTWKRRYMKRCEKDTYEMCPEIKKSVLFRQFNLMDTFPFKKGFHVIFLRNVMIYFDDNTRTELLEKMRNALEPGGYLIIGSTEAVNHKEIGLRYIKPSVFKKA